MKKISIDNKEIFEIAYLIKNKFPNDKIYIYKNQKQFFIKFNKEKINKLEIEELKTFLQIKYPQFIFVIKR